jgi:hypothetical protein
MHGSLLYRSPMQGIRCWLLIAILCAALLQSGALGESVPVRHVEGTIHGFLVLRTQEGHAIAVGDLVQVIHGERVISRLLFRFKDGSIDDETAEFSQHGTFQLITDHHIQKGPSFPKPMDMSIDVRRGEVTVRSTGKDGKEEVTTDHLDMPSDLANGMVLSLMKNIKPETPETKVSMIVATPKPRLVKLVISPRGEEPFSLQGAPRKATNFILKIELGGITGLVAPLIGKEPPDIHVWIIGGTAPAFVKEEGPFYPEGPIWNIQLTSPVWPHGPGSGL